MCQVFAPALVLVCAYLLSHKLAKTFIFKSTRWLENISEYVIGLSDLCYPSPVILAYQTPVVGGKIFKLLLVIV